MLHFGSISAPSFHFNLYFILLTQTKKSLQRTKWCKTNMHQIDHIAFPSTHRLLLHLSKVCLYLFIYYIGNNNIIIIWNIGEKWDLNLKHLLRYSLQFSIIHTVFFFFFFFFFQLEKCTNKHILYVSSSDLAFLWLITHISPNNKRTP